MLRLVEHDGQRVVHVPAQPHLRAVRALRRAEPTVRKGHPSTSADDRTRPLRPDELPPSVLRDRPELAAPLPDRLVPRLVRRHADLAVGLKAVTVVDEGVHMVVDRRQRRVDVDPLALEVGRQTVLPHEVDAFDLPLGLGGVREHERDVVELQAPAQLGELAVLAPEEPRLVHIDLQRQPVARKSPVKQVQIRPDALPEIEAAPDLPAAAVVEHVEKLIGRTPPAEEPVGRRVELPQLAYRLALPPPDVGGRTRSRNRDLDAVLHRPVTHLPPVDRMPEPPAQLARREGVRVPLRLPARAEHAPEEPLLLVRPHRLVVPTGMSGQPRLAFPSRLGSKIGCPQVVEPGLPYLQRFHCLFPRDGARHELLDRVTHMGDTQPVCYLFFHARHCTAIFRF